MLPGERRPGESSRMTGLEPLSAIWTEDEGEYSCQSEEESREFWLYVKGRDLVKTAGIEEEGKVDRTVTTAGRTDLNRKRRIRMCVAR
ncbi:hypothetical protein AOLI_G00038230 [Acnodon oligacanthus]